mmetsp:Transcript_26446/g.37233  ORF Transcript_26446/g.37233 Transcript_26446/m.37233 type:complete len:411 (-) Transcript_26446:41-1273(-)
MNVTNLPEESLLYILSFLDVIDLVNLSSVCKLFKRIAYDDYLWEFWCRQKMNANEIKCKGSVSWKELYASSYSVIKQFENIFRFLQSSQIQDTDTLLSPSMRHWAPISVDKLQGPIIQTIHEIKNMSRHVNRTTSRVVHLLNLLIEIFPPEEQTQQPSDPLHSPRLLPVLNELASIFLLLFQADILKQIEPRIQSIWNFYRYCLMSMKSRQQAFLEITEETIKEAQMYNEQFHLGVEPTDFLSRSEVSDSLAQSQPYKHALRWAFTKYPITIICDDVLPKLAELILTEHKKHDKGKPSKLFDTPLKDNIDSDWYWAALLAGVLLLYDSWSPYNGIYRKDAPFQLKECFSFLLKAEQKQADKAFLDCCVRNQLWSTNQVDGMFCKALMFCSRNYKDSASSGIKKMLKKYLS